MRNEQESVYYERPLNTSHRLSAVDVVIDFEDIDGTKFSSANEHTIPPQLDHKEEIWSERKLIHIVVLYTRITRPSSPSCTHDRMFQLGLASQSK